MKTENKPEAVEQEPVGHVYRYGKDSHGRDSTEQCRIAEELETAQQRIAELERELDNEQARGIHSCGPTCNNSGCVNLRLREQVATVQAAMAPVGYRFMDPPDGGSVTIAEQVTRMYERLVAVEDVVKACQFALEPYDDVKPRDWKTDRENLARAHQATLRVFPKPGYLGPF